VVARVAAATERLDAETARLRGENAGWALEFRTAANETLSLPLDQIVRAWQPNRLSLAGKFGVYLSRWGEFLGDDPREANSAGGVFPAIWGTVAMTLIMALLVAPFGVLAALYLKEYAGRGPVTTAVRVAINNLAGVPSIVYGAFGLGFFCYGLGAGIDELFFKASLVADSQPTFGTGGLLWAALTLALLTLPVVIVATEEALAAVPNSMREGSYACGAGKWQTIRRIVLPRALPGIMTGLILAMARGAGEVAPLMLVGVKKLALDLPIDGTFPFVHPEREFMHLAYLIYDVGFQSPNAQAAQPMVFTITFLLVAIIALLNVTAIWIRSRLRRRYVAQQF
jgi:phosphate transport system permease protein